MPQHEIVQQSQQCFNFCLDVVVVLAIFAFNLMVREQQIFKLVIWLQENFLDFLIFHQLVNFTRRIRSRLFIKLVIRL